MKISSFHSLYIVSLKAHYFRLSLQIFTHVNEANIQTLFALQITIIDNFEVSMMARFDYFLDKRRNPNLTSHGILSGKYFWITLVGYFIGTNNNLFA